MKYRKKPVVVEAVQLRWDTWNEMCFHADVPRQAVGVEGLPDNAIAMDIKTLEGTMRANQNDWVIKGVNGELYPCKPDIFEKTYEKWNEKCKWAAIDVNGRQTCLYKSYNSPCMGKDKFCNKIPRIKPQAKTLR